MIEITHSMNELNQKIEYQSEQWNNLDLEQKVLDYNEHDKFYSLFHNLGGRQETTCNPNPNLQFFQPDLMCAFLQSISFK